MNIINLIKESGLEVQLNQIIENDAQFVEANYKYHNNVISKYFFVYCDSNYFKKVITDSKVMDEFEENYIEPTFYSIEGDLSWNLYLVFVLEKTEFEKLKSDQKYAFENNERFTRKFVIDINDFLKYIPVGKVINKDDQKPILNPVGDWTSILEKENLTFCLERFLTDNVELFLENKVKNNNVSIDNTKIKNIKLKDYQPLRLNSLKIGSKFRDFCFNSNTNFDFRNVNLFSGPNGCGKTSVLDAIELTMTGEMKKNDQNDNNTSDLYQNDLNSKCQVVLSNNALISIPLEPGEKRKREILYYKSKDRGGAKLNTLFHQYNYYSYEDAYTFCYLNQQPDYNEEFSKIIFGESTKTTEKNWIRYKKGFEESLEKIRKQKSNITKQVNILENTKQTLSDTFSLDSIYNLLESIHIKFEKIKNDSDIDSLYNWLNITNQKITHLRMLVDNIVKSTNLNYKNEINERIDQDNELKIEKELNVSKIDNNITNINNYILSINNDVNRLNKNLLKVQNDIKENINYYNIFNSFDLIFNNIEKSNLRLKLENENQTLSIVIDKIKYVKQKWGTLTQIDFSNIDDEELSNKSDELNYKIEKLNKRYNEVVEIISIEENKNSNIENLISQIKLLGSQYISENTETCICPLCGKQHSSKQELFSAINKKVLVDKSNYTHLLKEKEDILLESKKANEEIDQVKLLIKYSASLERATNFIYDNNLIPNSTKPVSSKKIILQGLLKQVIESLDKELKEKEILDSHISSLELQGL